MAVDLVVDLGHLGPVLVPADLQAVVDLVPVDLEAAVDPGQTSYNLFAVRPVGLS